MSVFGEVFAGPILDRFLEALDEFLQISRGQIRVQLDFSLVLQLIHDVFEWVDLGFRMRLETENHIAVHLHESTVTVPGEAFVTGFFDQAAEARFIETDVENRVHHAGHGDAGPGAAGDEQRILGVAEFRAHDLFGLLQGLRNLRLEFGRILLAVIVVRRADFGRQGEAGGHGQADPAHFREVGPFAAEQVFLSCVAVGRAAAEKINVLGTHTGLGKEIGLPHDPSENLPGGAE